MLQEALVLLYEASEQYSLRAMRSEPNFSHVLSLGRVVFIDAVGLFGNTELRLQHADAWASRACLWSHYFYVRVGRSVDENERVSVKTVNFFFLIITCAPLYSFQ